MLIRERRPAEIEVFLLRRAGASAFMPDAYVFPGGAVDPADGSPPALARILGADERTDPALSVAALRELFEEAGILIAAHRDGSALRTGESNNQQLLDEMRAAAVDGRSLTEALQQLDLKLDARELVYYSNWITPPTRPRRFDTHFFIARAPLDQVAVADAVEVHDGLWLTPGEGLERADAGKITIMFPTRMHLKRLARYSAIDALLADARSRHVVAVMPDELRNFAFDLPPGMTEW